MNRRSFRTEFKLEAAGLVPNQGYSTPEACKSMDVGPTALRRWLKQLRSERGGTTPAAAWP
ncbi:transposase [Pseudomonas taeanensis]|uniref:transposase n=1 Tax=Pseudomonas taeanensis TaxID=574962 RepID=UPI0009F84D96